MYMERPSVEILINTRRSSGPITITITITRPGGAAHILLLKKASREICGAASGYSSGHARSRMKALLSSRSPICSSEGKTSYSETAACSYGTNGRVRFKVSGRHGRFLNRNTGVTLLKSRRERRVSRLNSSQRVPCRSGLSSFTPRTSRHADVFRRVPRRGAAAELVPGPPLLC
ncbi:hypothetical protein EYF80_041242 [Liparis tanakae]|uniref:Uncharacterized protein n=1 Tax=Liparis tanakae TaxID=230148 RepID=A0A4Z2G4P3_9TELE|nr:hypothetical protein EYF80_041242 [Liparis tanakae]